MGAPPPTVFAVCGLPGSGKTTFARKLARDHGAILFSADAWMLGLYGPDLPVSQFEMHRERVWEHIWTLATQFIGMNVSVVLDFSFYTRADRDTYRRRAGALGADFRIYFLRCERETARARIAARERARPPHTFSVGLDDFETLSEALEEPDATEEPGLVVVEADGDLVMEPV